MTTRSTLSGVQDDATPSSRVQKPPGGGSSNIFGPVEQTASAKPRAGAYMPAQSGIFKPSLSDTSVKGAAQRSSRDGDDSFNRLFGDNPAYYPTRKQKVTNPSQHVDTHANLFGMHPDCPTLSSSSDGESTHYHIFGENMSVAGGEAQTGRYSLKGRGSYNPITGADYKDLDPNNDAFHIKEPLQPETEQPTLPCFDGQYQAREDKMQNVQTSTRVSNPPGGKTHNLW